MTYLEILAGIKRKKARTEEQFFNRLFRSIPVLGFDREAAEESSGIAARLASSGVELNPLDVLIAGTAARHGANRIITDDRDFLDIARVVDIEMVMYR